MGEINLVRIPKFQQFIELVADRPIFPILDIARPLIAMPPLLQQIGRYTDNECCPIFVQDRIVVISRERLWLDSDVFLGDFSPMRSLRCLRWGVLDLGCWRGAGTALAAA